MNDRALVQCSNCGSIFACNPAGDCWCKTPPYVPVQGPEETCLCPNCLDKLRAALPGAEDK